MSAYRHTGRWQWLPSSPQKRWWMWEPSPLLIKWFLVIISPPLNASVFSSKALEALEPQMKPSPLQKCLSVAFGLLRERTWPPCFSLFLNLSHIILAVPITRYQSPVQLWILLSIWPQQCLWQAHVPSYSYIPFYLLKCLALQVYSCSHVEIVTGNITA